ncbi:MAG TPA: hypothetical protein VIL46_12135 [Gemmataceae bacterium]
MDEARLFLLERDDGTFALSPTFPPHWGEIVGAELWSLRPDYAPRQKYEGLTADEVATLRHELTAAGALLSREPVPQSDIDLCDQRNT